MSLTVNKVAQRVSKKFIIPAAIAASALLSTTALKAQEPQQDTLQIKKQEVVKNTTKKEKTHWGDILLGTLFISSMGALGLSGHINKKNQDLENSSEL